MTVQLVLRPAASTPTVAAPEARDYWHAEDGHRLRIPVGMPEDEWRHFLAAREAEWGVAHAKYVAREMLRWLEDVRLAANRHRVERGGMLLKSGELLALLELRLLSLPQYGVAHELQPWVKRETLRLARKELGVRV